MERPAKSFNNVCCSSVRVAQDESNLKTLIPQTTIERIVDEVSGSLVFQHIVELASAIATARAPPPMYCTNSSTSAVARTRRISADKTYQAK